MGGVSVATPNLLLLRELLEGPFLFVPWHFVAHGHRRGPVLLGCVLTPEVVLQDASSNGVPVDEILVSISCVSDILGSFKGGIFTPPLEVFGFERKDKNRISCWHLKNLDVVGVSMGER